MRHLCFHAPDRRGRHGSSPCPACTAATARIGKRGLSGSSRARCGVEQADWDAPDIARWAQSLRDLLARERGPFVLAAHSFGCLATAHALQQASYANDVVGVLFVAPASPQKFAFAGSFDARRLGVPSILIGSETDPWMPLAGARDLAQRFGSAFVNLGDAGHINTAAGFGPWPRAKYFSIRSCIARRRCAFAKRRSRPRSTRSRE